MINSIHKRHMQIASLAAARNAMRPWPHRLPLASSKRDTSDLINLAPDERMRRRIKQIIGLDAAATGPTHFEPSELRDWTQHVLKQVSNSGHFPQVMQAITKGQSQNEIFALYGRRSRQLSEMHCRTETWVLPPKLEVDFLRRVREIAAKALGTTLALYDAAAKRVPFEAPEKYKDFHLIALGFFLIFPRPFLLDKLGKIIPNDRCLKAVNLDAFLEYPYNAAETRREFAYGVILQRFLSRIPLEK